MLPIAFSPVCIFFAIVQGFATPKLEFLCHQKSFTNLIQDSASGFKSSRLLKVSVLRHYSKAIPQRLYLSPLRSEDNISKFPDDLIHLILSLLPTKQAVATSVLSKRWISLWTLVSQIIAEPMNKLKWSFVWNILEQKNYSSVEKFVSIAV